MNNFKDIKVAVAGTGYVGLSIATLLSQHHHVTAVDVIPEKVEKLNNRVSPIQDDYIEKYLAEKELDLTATLDAQLAYSNADFVEIAAPTNYDPVTQHFDKRIVDSQFLQLLPCFLVSEPILQSRGASQRRNSTDLQTEEKSAIRRMRQTTRT